MSGLITSALDQLRSYSGSIAWDPLLRLSRTAVLSLLQQIKSGQLTVYEGEGTKTVCGEQSGGTGSGPLTELRVRREVFWLRLALYADMVS